MEEKSYRLNMKKIPSVLCMAFGSFVLFFLLDMFIFKPIPNGTLPLNLVCVILLAIGLSVLIFFTHKDRFIKISSSGIDIINGKKTQHYEFKDFEGTDVVKHYTNGIYTNTTRAIKLRDTEKNKVRSIDCTKLKPAEFDELIAYLGKTEFEQVEKTEATETYFDTEKYFEINKDEICAKRKSKNIISIVITLIVAVLLAVFFFAVIFSVDALIAVVSAVICALIAGVIVAIIANNIKKFPASVPARVTIDNYNLGIDGTTIDKEKTAKIIMTPPTYTSKDRVMEIVMSDGTKHKYNFGRLRETTNGTYPDYPSLFSNVKLWCLQRNISFLASLS